MSSSHTPAPNQVVFTCVQRKSRFSANAYQLPPRARRSLRRERLSQSTHSVCGLGQSLGRRAPGSARGRHRTLRAPACARGSGGHGPLRTLSRYHQTS